DDDAALGRACLDDPTALAAVLAGEDLHRVALLHLHLRGHLQHLWSQADDLHEVLLAQLTRDGAEDARPARVRLLVDEDGGVLVEADERAVAPAEGLLRAPDDRTHDFALLHRALGRGGLHRSNDDVADPRVAPVRTAEHADAQDLSRSRVVRDPET